MFKNPELWLELTNLVNPCTCPRLFVKARDIGVLRDVEKLHKARIDIIIKKYKQEKRNLSTSSSSIIFKKYEPEKRNLSTSSSSQQWLPTGPTLSKELAEDVSERLCINSSSSVLGTEINTIHTVSLSGYPKVCPPHSEGKIVLYVVSNPYQRAFHDCNRIHSILEWHHVEFDMRDLSIHIKYENELKKLVKTLSVPRLFVEGRDLGDLGDLEEKLYLINEAINYYKQQIRTPPPSSYSSSLMSQERWKPFESLSAIKQPNQNVTTQQVPTAPNRGYLEVANAGAAIEEKSAKETKLSSEKKPTTFCSCHSGTKSNVIKNPLISYPKRFPPDGQINIILYVWAGLYNMNSDCEAVLKILEEHKVEFEKRNVRTSRRFDDELKRLVGASNVPRLFVQGRDMGELKDVEKLHKSRLSDIIQYYKEQEESQSSSMAQLAD